MYGYKAVLEATRRGDTYEKGIIRETPRIHCCQRTFTFMCIALFDKLLFRMRCRQLRREAREAGERLIEVLEDSELDSPVFV